MRWGKRLGALLLLTLGMLLFPLSGVSSALGLPGDWVPGDCNSPPVPSNPLNGVLASLQIQGNPPAQADPFEPAATTTIYQQYGVTGFNFHQYALGDAGSCALQDPLDAIEIGLANLLQMGPQFFYSVTGAIGAYAFHPERWTHALDPLVMNMMDTVRKAVVVPFAGVMVLAAAVYIVWHAHRISAAKAARTLGGILAVLTLVMLAVTGPMEIPRHTDAAMKGGTATVANAAAGTTGTGADPAAVAVGVMVDSALYDRWVDGTLGNAGSPLATEYGPRLFKDQALTFAEAKIVNTGSDAGKALIKAKQDDWKAAADEIKDKDPTAYEYLQGRHGNDTLGAVAMMYVAAASSAPFLLMAFLLMFGGYLIARMGTVAVPVFGVLALFPRTQHLLFTPLRWIAASIVNVTLFTLAALLDVAAVRAILSPALDLPGWLKLVILAIITALFWVALKPLRSLTSMVRPGYDPARQTRGVVDGLRRGAMNYATSYLGSRRGAMAGVAEGLGDRSDLPQAAKPGAGMVHVDADNHTDSRTYTTVTREPQPEPQPEAPTRAAVSAASEPGTPAVGYEAAPERPELGEGTRSLPASDEGAQPQRVTPEVIDGEEVYVIYTPGEGYGVEKPGAAPETIRYDAEDPDGALRGSSQ